VLEACIAAGMKYPESLRQVAEAIPNQILRRTLREGADMIEREELHSCSAALARLPLQKTTLDLCQSGEHSGAFEDALRRCVVFEQERFQRALHWAAKTINAIVYGIAIMVAVIVIFAAMYAYVSKINSITSRLGGLF
jgi:type II secretory pathway component PulF